LFLEKPPPAPVFAVSCSVAAVLFFVLFAPTGTPFKMLRQQLQTTCPAQVKVRPAGQVLVATPHRRVRVFSSVDELIKPAAPSTPDAVSTLGAVLSLLHCHIKLQSVRTLCCNPSAKLHCLSYTSRTIHLASVTTALCSLQTEYEVLLSQLAVCTTQTRHRQLLQ
jgi:hypothetical protein